jgi:hypothetical protein
MKPRIVFGGAMIRMRPQIVEIVEGSHGQEQYRYHCAGDHERQQH